MKSQKIVSLNPSNYEVIGEVDSSSSHEIDTKINNARTAYASWSNLSIKERVISLEKLYRAFENKKNDIRSLIAQEIGMPISVCDQIDIDPGLRYMRGYLDYAEQWLACEITYETEDEIHILSFEPKGVVAASVPWNYPFSIFIWAVIQNLVVGNTVVVKHSEECPFTGKLLEKIIQSAGLPEGVFNAVYGDGSVVG
jgi:acyl-CoA reductase-like NAD-dependent aldehyde dehydrogenase